MGRRPSLVWDLNALLFSDVPSNRMMCWTESRGCAGVPATRRVSRTGTRGIVEGRLIDLLALAARGVNGPNTTGTGVVLADLLRRQATQLAERRRGQVRRQIWFSDPAYGIAGDYQGERAAEEELPCSVYRLDPRDGDLDRH